MHVLSGEPILLSLVVVFGHKKGPSVYPASTRYASLLKRILRSVSHATFKLKICPYNGTRQLSGVWQATISGSSGPWIGC